jgi:hypothetical protein
MPEWFVERGIGENRLALIDGGTIVAARIEPEGMVACGSVVPARLVTASPRPLARLEDGTEILLSRAPAKVSEGGSFLLAVRRPALPGPEKWKRALGEPIADGDHVDGKDQLTPADLPFPPVARDPLREAGWDDLLAEAESGRVSFPGGELLLALTPAMTVIDVDGWLPARDLAIAGAAEAARAIRRLDLQGNIGIDLPTTPGKEPRAAAAAALDAVLAGEPFERTSVNGFGFLQLIRPRRRPSLLELAHDAPAFAARALLRRAARDGHGAASLVVHPRVAAVLRQHPEWLEKLGRQRGGTIGLREDPGLAISAGHVAPL